MITPTKIYLFLGSILVIIIATIFALFSSPAQPAQQGSNSFPTASSTNQSGNWIPGGTNGETATTSALVVAGAGNSQIAVKDFLHASATVPDPENPGTYFLAGTQGAPSTNFSIIYDANKQFFTIALTAEPIGPARIAAQTFLEATLGIDDQAACALRYYVGTTYWVNSLYDDRNLGFSFCAGATKMPQ